MIVAGIIALSVYLCKIRRRSQRRKHLIDDEHYLVLPTKEPPSYHQQRSVGVATKHVSSQPSKRILCKFFSKLKKKNFKISKF